MPVSYSDFNESFGQIWVLFVSVVAGGGGLPPSFHFDLFRPIKAVHVWGRDARRYDTVDYASSILPPPSIDMVGIRYTLRHTNDIPYNCVQL